MAFGSFALIKLGSFPSPSPLVVSPSLRGLLAPVAEHPVVAVVVVSQEVDAVVDVDEEDTKCLGLGRQPPLSEHAGNAQPFALPFRLDPTTTYRYHDHLRRFGVDGITVSCLDMAPCYGHSVKGARVIFSSQITLKFNLPDAFGRMNPSPE